MKKFLITLIIKLLVLLGQAHSAGIEYDDVLIKQISYSGIMEAPKPPPAQYRTVTRYVQEPVYGYVKYCNGRQCWYEYEITGYRKVKKTERVLVQSTKAGAEATPMDKVDAMLSSLHLKPNELLVDFGCGADARILIRAAQRFGVRGYGFEIDETRYLQAKATVQEAGLSDRITIIHGDSTKYDISSISPDAGVAYLYPDTLKALVPEIKKLKRFASYQHKIHGLRMEEREEFYVWTAPRSVAVPRPRVAIWGGYQYTGRLCNNPNCRMCNSIQRQLGF